MANQNVRTLSPKAGQTLMVRHRSKQNKGGVAGMHPCSNRDSEVQTIRAVYADGRVKSMSGDVWAVKRATDGRYDWETIFGGDA